VSNVLAIAAVTQLLKDLLNDALINGDVTGALGADFTVSALPPHLTLAEEGESQPTILNLFLHGVTPNASLRNLDLPTRSAAGAVLRKPTLALDLHYMLTVVSAEELHAEILLGYAMLLFHEVAILPRETVRAALSTAAATAAVSDEILPGAAAGLIRASEIADQFELLKITPRSLGLEDMSRLWTALQVSYRTTVAYDVSVVLIERERPVRPALPVLTRGGPRNPATGRDPGVLLRPDVGAVTPTLEMIAPADGQIVMRLGGAVDLIGQALNAPGARVRFTEPATGTVLFLAPDEPATSGRLRVRLPGGAPLVAGHALAGTGSDPGTWRIGPYVVDVLYDDPMRAGLASNALAAVLAPSTTVTLAHVGGATQLTFSVEPRIRPSQSVAAMAGQEMVLVPAPAAATGTVTASIPDLARGASLPVRLRVDGIDSPIIDRAARPPVLLTEVIP
jgi:hypothetical protein